MNSLNHCAFGSVGEWMMRCVAGIEPDPMAPGYARFYVYPRCGIQIPSAGGSYHSIRGKIETRWTRDAETFTLEVTVPPNTAATVIIPARSVEELREGGKPIAEAAPHVVMTQFQGGNISLDVRAGRYRFESKLPK
jgi:alpha-L-rhamnosidase